jgi:chromosome segregation protein
MRLKTLEIKGFKSFANETVIHFDEDVIGIVGPNGSGKSNIVDAVRWVLGEQKSRELRLDTMSSVIFNGTKKRRQGGLAQVTLTFENTKNVLPTDYQTVSISRILYRSGESEYRLNGITCRLKDITSLFLDTGIGSNSYAIIALGMVDDILSDKENARRKMFEQASGISKYKIRKRETLNKLKNTSEDLERIEDLLHEIEANLKTLEKQAKRTKKYFEYKEQYKELSIELAIRKSAVIKTKQFDLKAKLDQEEDKYRNLEIEARQLEAKLEREKKGNLDKEKALSDSQRDLNQLVGNIRQMESDKKMVEQRIGFNQQNKEKVNDSIRFARQTIFRLEEEIENYRTDLHEEKMAERDMEAKLDEAEEALKAIKENHGNLKQDLDHNLEIQQGISNEIFELEKQKAVNANKIESISIEQTRLESDQLSSQEAISDLKEEHQVLERTHNRLEQQLDHLYQKEEQRDAALLEVQQKMDNLNKETQAINRKLDSKNNEYKLIKSMVESMEGFPESIKFLSKNDQWNNQAPLLSDIIYVKEEYRVAIENFLEPYLSYYVVSNLDEAKTAISLLSKSQKGKANFFILDEFKNTSPGLLGYPNLVSAASEVSVDDKYRKLLDYLLDGVCISEKENLDNALESGDHTILSKSGKFIQTKYHVVGGSVGLFEGKKIGRKKNLEMLEKEISELEETAIKLEDKYYLLKNEHEQLQQLSIKADIKQTEVSLNKCLQERAQVTAKLNSIEQNAANSTDRIKQYKAEVLKLNETNLQVLQTLKNKQEELANLKININSTDGTFRKISEEMSKANEIFNQTNISFIQQQNKVGALQRELSFREKNLENTSSELQQNEQSLNSSDSELVDLNSKIVELQDTLQVSYSKKSEKEAKLTQAEQDYFQARGIINEIDDQIRKLGRQGQEAQSLINGFREKLNETKFEISTIGERLRIEFQIEINDVINQEPKNEFEEEILNEKVEKLRKRLENYGEINPMAVEAYDEMKERYDNITTQRDDILEAKKDLEDTIKEIEHTATTQFLDAFEKARLYFIDVFRSLFTEDDNCDLILLDPDNPLESKIEIVAKPKGKRPQSISQLSGGEKTLTATALLFALYLLKPAPFCIFDEVDAPLDDANIEKFNRIIKKFSKDSQFIIVTHNKATMAAVDTIYGVFMHEQGVSGVSHVDFRSFDNSGVFESTGS